MWNGDILKMLVWIALENELSLGLTLRFCWTELLWGTSCLWIPAGTLKRGGNPLFPIIPTTWEWCLRMTSLEDPCLLMWVSWALVDCGSPAHCVHCPKRGNSGKLGALSFLLLLPKLGVYFLIFNVKKSLYVVLCYLRHFHTGTYCMLSIFPYPPPPLPVSPLCTVSPFCCPRQFWVFFHAIQYMAYYT